MPSITIEVQGGDFVQQGLGDVQREIPKILSDRINNSAYLIGAHFKVYPPPPPKSTYIRTGKLAESVRLRLGSTGATISIDPVSPKGKHYGIYVIGDGVGSGQAWMHKNRWPLLKDVAEKVMTSLPQDVENELREKIKQVGLA